MIKTPEEYYALDNPSKMAIWLATERLRQERLNLAVKGDIARARQIVRSAIQEVGQRFCVQDSEKINPDVVLTGIQMAQGRELDLSPGEDEHGFSFLDENGELELGCRFTESEVTDPMWVYVKSTRNKFQLSCSALTDAGKCFAKQDSPRCGQLLINDKLLKAQKMEIKNSSQPSVSIDCPSI